MNDTIQRPRTGGRRQNLTGWVTAKIGENLRKYARKHDIASTYVMEVALRAYMLKGEPSQYPVGTRDFAVNFKVDDRLYDDVDKYCAFYYLTERELLNYALDAFDWTKEPELLLWRRLTGAKITLHHGNGQIEWAEWK